MNYVGALTELVIAVRERGDLDPLVQQACRRVEQKITELRDAKERRDRRERPLICERCSRRASGVLCWRCEAEAPTAVRTAFLVATGLDGIRKATQIQRDYAHGQYREDAA